jgi:hypothetical protein
MVLAAALIQRKERIMIALPAQPARVALVSGLLLVLLVLLVLALVSVGAHLGSTPMLHSGPLASAGVSGGPGWP